MATTTVPPERELFRKNAPPSPIVKLYVWELPVRISHWLIAASLAVLGFTGYYIHDPFLVSYSPTQHVMGTMRFIHITAGWVLLSALLLRVYWFCAGNIWACWRAFLPLTKRQKKSLKTTFTYYSFFTGHPFNQAGHNALAGMTYLIIYALVAFECFTGLVLFSAGRDSSTLSWLVGWSTHILDIQYMRMLHYGTLFGFMIFFIHHIYSAVLTSHEERNGLMESIFTGYKLVSPQLVREELENGKEQRSLKLLCFRRRTK